MKTAVIFINIGSPDSYEVADVRKYLGEFLMDEDVITAPFPIRWLLVNAIIKPFRAPQSAKKYKSIWMKEGSPLKVLSHLFCDKMKAYLEISEVYFSMRYGHPNLSDTIGSIDKNKIKKIIVIPMYPQFAAATTGSSIKEFRRSLASINNQQSWTPEVQILEPFFDSSFFIKTFSNKIKTALRSDAHILFSYHGLPISQVKNVSDCSADSTCLNCEIGVKRNCYRAQCLKTSQLIATELGINPSQYTTSFQSRLGPTKWLEPSTENTLQKLPAEGKNKVLVCCPAFATDCLETLEEINIHGRKNFLEHGGYRFDYVTCLNDDSSWIEAFGHIIKKSLI